MGATGYLHHSSFLEHDAGPGHPESPARARAVEEALRRSGLAGSLELDEAEPADRELLGRLHTPGHVDAVEAAARRAPVQLDPDTRVSAASWDAAVRAAGAAVHASDRVREGAWRNAFVCARPPGHHAERGRAMGFCLFNNVAAAALHLREQGAERVAIVDFDVHHGNGTQHRFEDDPSVFYASLHQWPHYPGTGAESERGTGEGEGATLNVPLSAGTGDAEWRAAMDERVLPALEGFAPEFLLISAGFDAHADDMLSGTRLTSEGFRQLTRSLLAFAREHCGGRVVSLLEGGYHLDALAASAHAHVEELVSA
jgi:acetoin utilization deacetylase AcuC-like enzyme